MTHLHFPWLDCSIVISLIGVLAISLMRDFDQARKWCLVFSGLTLATTVGAWLDFYELHTRAADDGWNPLAALGLVKDSFLVVDQLSAPLLPLVALLYFLTTLATLRTKIRRFSFALTLVSQTISVSVFSCRDPRILACLLSAGTIPILLELIIRRKSIRVFLVHMVLYVVPLLIGAWMLDAENKAGSTHSPLTIALLVLAIAVRTGIVPFHCWMSDLFEHATFGSALLFVTPMAGTYAAMRLLIPIAPDWLLHLLGFAALLTSIYAAGMAQVQREVRRYFCYLFLSMSSLVMVGLEIVSPMAMTGALCVWLSIAMALGGFGLTMRALEARRGRLSLTDFKGLYEHTPALAVCFLLTGLAAVGFPGTLGFVGSELLVDGAVISYPWLGVGIVIAMALNGIGMVQTYFKLFTGTRYSSTVSLQIRPRERFAVLLVAGLILFGGMYPHTGVTSRHDAAEEFLQVRHKNLGTKPAPHAGHEEHASNTAAATHGK